MMGRTLFPNGGKSQGQVRLRKTSEWSKPDVDDAKALDRNRLNRKAHPSIAAPSMHHQTLGSNI
jgi:hypothetical protein